MTDIYTIEKFKGDDGRVKVRIDLQSETLKVVQIDTYSTFTGDSWEEQEIEGICENYDLDKENAWKLLDFSYDFPAILKDLAEASIAALISETSRDGIIESVEFKDTWSPKEYNFRTDSYDATFVVDFLRLKKWLKKSGKDREEWFRNRWESRSGFHSFMYPGYWNDPEYMEGMRIYAAIAMYIEAETDGETMFYSVQEQEWEIFNNHVTASISESDYAEELARLIGLAVSQPFDADDHLGPLLDARATTIEQLMADNPLSPKAAADVLLERPSDKPLPGQMAAF